MAPFVADCLKVNPYSFTALTTAPALFFVYREATLRIYLERFEADISKHDQDAQTALTELTSLAEQICEVKKRADRTGPDVVS